MPDLDPVTRYAADVDAGRVVAGRLVTLACRRHLTDLANASGLVWNADEAQRVIAFFADVLCLPEDTAAEETAAEEIPADGSPFRLQPWQQFIVGSLMGWYTTAGYRRFHDAYIEGAKGCGKTPMGAGLMLYLLVADEERGAQIFFAAVGREQAKIAFADAVKMVHASPYLRALVDQKVNNLAVLETGSFLRPISSEHRGLDGKRVHGAMIDEEHEHASPVVVSKIRRGTKGRRNALVMRTTNSGFDRTSVCWRDHEYSRQVLEGAIEDESWFAYVCGLDPCPACLEAGKAFPSDDCAACDDWRTEGPHWLKANPNLGVSLSWQYLRELVRQAKGRPDVVSDLLRFNFCVWTSSESRAISMHAWAACQAPPPASALVGLPCFGGLDLGQSDDFSAWARLWVLDDERLVVQMRFWVPRAALVKYPERPYAEWERVGVLTVTDGNTTHYRQLEDTIAADCKADGVREVGYDKRFAEQMAQNLQDDHAITMVDTPQGFYLNEPIRRLLDAIVNGTLCHGGNPILTWMASNFVVEHGKRDGALRAAKEHAADKIDGIVAIVLALERVMRMPKLPAYQLLVLGGAKP